MAGVLAALGVALATQGPSFGALLWVVAISAAAVAVAFTLSWWPETLRPLGRLMPCCGTPMFPQCSWRVSSVGQPIAWEINAQPPHAAPRGGSLPRTMAVARPTRCRPRLSSHSGKPLSASTSMRRNWPAYK
jgi:hypothetical protein